MCGWQSWWRETIKHRPNISIKKLKDRGYLKDCGDKAGVIERYYDWYKRHSMKLCVCNSEDKSYVVLIFTKTDEQTLEENKYELLIHLSKTKCNYWWYRHRFICRNCQKRYTHLYLWENSYFYCRKCLNLCYPEQKVSKLRRNGLNFLRNKEEANETYSTIKYMYRNGKKTRKYLRYCRLNENYANVFI